MKLALNLLEYVRLDSGQEQGIVTTSSSGLRWAACVTRFLLNFHCPI